MFKNLLPKKQAAKVGTEAKKVGKAVKKAVPSKKEVAKKVAPVKKAVEKKGFSLFSKAKKAAPVVEKKAAKAVKSVKKAVPSKKAAVKAVKRTPSTGSKAGGQNLDKWYGPSRALFLPNGLLDPNDVPTYLSGELAGDYGYDPLGLGAEGKVDQYRTAELIHARWAMLGAAGIIIPEGLEAAGAPIHGGTWFETGAEMLNGGTLDYFAVPFGVVANPLPLFAITGIEIALLGAAEFYRRNGTGPAGYSPGVGKFDSSVFDGADSLYPGGPFDPFKFSSDPEVLQELKVKEIKNGRLAMVSVLAFAAQGYVTGEGPYANWAKHVADPFGYNLFTVLVSEDRVPSL